MATMLPAPRERLRTALGRVMATFTEREASDEQLSMWGGLMERFAEELEGTPPEHVLWAYTDRGVLAAHGVRSSDSVQPQMVREGDQLTARVQFAPRTGGATGHVHGGDIAAAFDVVLGSFFGTRQPPVVTRRLEVRFLSPVPAGCEGEFEGRLTAAGPRHFRAEALLTAGGRLCASAEAEFVQPKQ